MNPTRNLLLLTLALTGCFSPRPQEWRAQGTIPASGGGAPGYQHGPQHTRFVIGDHPKVESKYSYLKISGRQGTVAVDSANGSTFAIPSRDAASLKLPPFGNSSDDHDSFVKDYFLKLGLPRDQVAKVHGMTMLEAHGPAAEAGRKAPHTVAYYSALERTVEGVPVPDSFAWARVNSHGDVVQEAAYWPSLPASVLSEIHQFRDLIAEPQRLQTYKSHLPVSGGDGVVAIHHSSAAADQEFDSFASFDLTFHLTQMRAQKALTDGTSVSITRHFDISGKERFLPQERLNLGEKYPATKQPAAKTNEAR